MTILWRFLLSQFTKVLIFCIVAFVAILLTTRLNEIASFTTLGPAGKFIFWFTLYQIPYILPIAIPISCLISTIILIQQLSSTHELVALRAGGLSIGRILSPLLLSGALIAFANFIIISEVATATHLATNIMKNDLRSINPLLLLQNKHLMEVKGFYFDTLGPSKLGEVASQVIFATPNKDNNRINLLIADTLKAEPLVFVGDGVSLLTSFGPDDQESFDNLMIENIKKTSTTIQDFSQMVEKKVWTLNNDYLNMSLLLVRISLEKKGLAEALQEGRPANEIRQYQDNINRGYTEIVKRISVGIAAFTFTLMGAAFGISISRNRSSKNIIWVVILSALYLMAFFSTKGIEHLFVITSLLYIVPQVIIIGLSLWAIKRVAKGIE